MPQCKETEINTPPESKLIADQNGTFIFSIGLSCGKLRAFEWEQCASWFQSHAVLISACKLWTHRTSGSVRHRTIAWKYAYKNLMLHSGSPTHSVVMHVRSSALDRSLRIEYWTLNSRNVNSMFAMSGRFFHSPSHFISFLRCCKERKSPKPVMFTHMACYYLRWQHNKYHSLMWLLSWQPSRLWTVRWVFENYSFILSPKIKSCDLTWTWWTVSECRAGCSPFLDGALYKVIWPCSSRGAPRRQQWVFHLFIVAVKASVKP